jgi:hypothetical protein
LRRSPPASCAAIAARSLESLGLDQGTSNVASSLVHVPGDPAGRHVDLSWVRSELAPFYPEIGRPSIDPELMIRMLIIGYVFAIRSGVAECATFSSSPDGDLSWNR